MAESLYGRLFRYRERPKNAPLENFLTEALADLLNRMPRAEAMEAVERLFLQSAESRAVWRTFLAKNSEAEFTWSTQFDLEVDGRHFRPDLVLEARGALLIIVENKITARLAKHQAAVAGGEGGAVHTDGAVSPGNGRNQLQTYGKGLANLCNSAGEWKGALVFLTHACVPPADFVDGSIGIYGVPWQAVTHWCEVWRWLKRLGNEADIRDDREGARASSDYSPPWRALAVELANFLEEKQMSAEYMTHFDLAATHVFVASAARVNETFNAIWRRLRTSIERSRLPIVRKARTEIESVFSVRSDWGVIWETRYIKDAPGWWVGWGIRFPEFGQHFEDASLPTETHAFVEVSYDERPLPTLDAAHKHLLPKGWTVVPETNELVAARVLRDFSAASDRMTAELAEWISERVEEVAPAVLQLCVQIQ